MERKPPPTSFAVTALFGARMMPNESGVLLDKNSRDIRKIYQQVFHGNENDRQRGTGTQKLQHSFSFSRTRLNFRDSHEMIGEAVGIWDRSEGGDLKRISKESEK
jgi:hypothetical protein